MPGLPGNRQASGGPGHRARRGCTRMRGQFRDVSEERLRRRLHEDAASEADVESMDSGAVPGLFPFRASVFAAADQ